MENDHDSGENMRGWFASYDPDSSSWRTSQRSLFEDSTECSPTLPRSGTMQNGRLYPRQMPVRPTSASGSSSLLPTPSACSYGTNRSPGGKARPSLETMARRGMIPTPTATDHQRGAGHPAKVRRRATLSGYAVYPWPTPRSRDHKDCGAQTDYAKVGPERLAGRAGGPLSPRWVEWLMGFPDGWITSVASETPSSRKSRRSSGSEPDSSSTEDT